MRIAVVGAGIAGLSCATRLLRAGHAVHVFDKGRGAGGRMATRRVATPIGEIAFDHGAQYFTAREPRFCAAVMHWETDGIVARWPAAGNDAWVGTPGMNAVAMALAAELDVTWNCRIGALHRTDAGWLLHPISEVPVDCVIVATPAEQAAPLLAPHDDAMAQAALGCRSSPCWTVMAAFEAPLALPDIVRHAGIIDWAARNSAKPGRTGPEAWVIHADPDWSKDHLEDPEQEVVIALLAALAACARSRPPPAAVSIGHRWRYARAGSEQRGSLWRAGIRLGAAGDWLYAPRVESAWLSGQHVADQVCGAIIGTDQPGAGPALDDRS